MVEAKAAVLEEELGQKGLNSQQALEVAALLAN